MELGPEINGLRVVKQGLAPGEVIVVNGLQHVRPGQTVAPTRVAMVTNSGGLAQVAAQPHRQVRPRRALSPPSLYDLAKETLQTPRGT